MRYQWSNKYKDEIIVVEQTDGKWDDFILDIEKARTTFNTPKAENIPDITDALEPHYCQEHQVPFKERTGKFGTFFSHSMGVYPNLTYCNEKL